MAAWFKGKTDPDLAMLALTLEDGEAWASTDSKLKFGWEMARANVQEDHEPEVGVHTELKF